MTMWISMGVAIGLAFYSFASIRAGRDHLRRAEARRSWPYVVGRITSSKRGVSARWDPDQLCFEPQVTYVYTVNGKALTSSRIGFRSYQMHWAQADEVGRTYAVDRDVEVFFDPQDPATSVLDPTVTGGRRLFLTAAVYFAAALRAASFAILSQGNLFTNSKRPISNGSAGSHSATSGRPAR